MNQAKHSENPLICSRQRSFNNYVYNILSFFDHLLIPTGNIFTQNMDKNRHFLITYPPHLVHVVFKRPPLSICVSNSQEPLAKDRNYVNDYLSALNCHKICQKSKKMIHIWRLARSTLHKKTGYCQSRDRGVAHHHILG